jgi:hypothetical protein
VGSTCTVGSRITETHCVHVTARVASHESVPKARPPEQRCYRCFNLELTKLPAAAFTLEDDNKAVIGPTRKKGPVIQKSQRIDGISMLDEVLR